MHSHRNWKIKKLLITNPDYTLNSCWSIKLYSVQGVKSPLFGLSSNSPLNTYTLQEELSVLTSTEHLTIASLIFLVLRRYSWYSQISKIRQYYVEDKCISLFLTSLTEILKKSQNWVFFLHSEVFPLCQDFPLVNDTQSFNRVFPYHTKLAMLSTLYKILNVSKFDLNSNAFIPQQNSYKLNKLQYIILIAVPN